MNLCPFCNKEFPDGYNSEPHIGECVIKFVKEHRQNEKILGIVKE